ncbi:MAG: capsule assembly Wzi family protein, partial [Aquificaceae bacterium]|nr:capsule assembly Wzi family protein [Aquificaceae bacterium]
KAGQMLLEVSSYCRKSKLVRYAELIASYNTKRTAFSLLPEEEGIRLEEGYNLHYTIGGDAGLADTLYVAYTIRGVNNRQESNAYVHRLSIQARLANYFLVGGKDNIKVGPSRYGNLLSTTAPPFYHVRFQNYYPIELGGFWDFIFLYGRLLEKREDHSDPHLLFFRINYKPTLWLEAGVNRAILYGGSGRPTYKLEEYPKLIVGREETVGGRFDNDSYFGYDLRFNLNVSKFDLFELYYENNATDVESPLKKGDPNKIHFPLILFKFHDDAKTYGLRLKREKLFLNWELTKTSKTMYTHHRYPVDGFTYKDFVLGYPYGRSVLHTFVLLGYVEKELEHFIEGGYLRQPHDLPASVKSEVFYISYRPQLKSGRILIVPYMRVEHIKNPNIAEKPIQLRINQGEKLNLVGGVKLKWEF